MKVVLISSSDRGGAGIAAARLHMALLELGVDSWFLTFNKFTNTLPKHIKYRTGDTVRFSFVANLIAKLKRGLGYYKLYSTAEGKLTRKHLSGRKIGFEHFSLPFSSEDLQKHPLLKDADVIHLNWVSDGFLDYDKFFRNISQKYVWTLHDMNPFTGGCHHADGCVLFSKDCSACFQLEGTKDSTYSRNILEYKTDALKNIASESMIIVTPSEWLGKLSSNSSLFKRFKHFTIQNPFDPTLFSMLPSLIAKQKLGLDPIKKNIFINAHHFDNPRKGLSYLLNALKKLDANKYQLSVAGHSMNQLEFPNVKLLGYLNDEADLSLAYSAADVFVIPSLAENLPNTICESLLCGTPVIAFEVGGIPELINPSNGMMVPLKDEIKLAQAIEDVTSKEWDRNQIRSAALLKLDKRIVGKKYLDIYTTLTSKR